ncbi:MAG: hypothetical protein LBG21_02980, partial [Campylobacteraceae bacterium]|nr:hypothetical protein [Campylobacteraceae bacterium]
MAKIIRPNMTLPIFGEDEADKLTVFGTGKDVTDTGTPAQNVEGIVKGDGSKWKKGWIFQNP